MADYTIKVIAEGEDRLSGPMKDAGDGVVGLGANITTALAGAAVVGAFAAVGKGIMDLAAVAGEEQKGIILLGQAVRNTGADWDTASAAIEAYLTAELARTALDDGDGRLAIQRLTEATGSYETALDLMGLAQDLAAAKGISVSDAAMIVGKVHEGNTGILGRYGITLGEGATATEALAAMTGKFGGAAEAMGTSYEGSQKRLGTAMTNIKESIGAALMTAIQPLLDSLGQLAMAVLPVVEEGIAKLQPVFNWLQTDGKPIAIALAVVIGSVLVAALYAMAAAAWAAAAPMIASIAAIMVPLLPFIAIVVGIGALIALVRTAWVKDWGGIQEKTASVLAWFTGAWETVSSWFVEAFTKTIPEAFVSVGQAIRQPFQDAWDWLQGLWGGLRAWIEGIFSNIHIPLPHFSLNWTEVLGIRIPSGVNVDWYGSGLDAIISSPTLIGVGERGAERVTVTPMGAGGQGRGGDTYNFYVTELHDKVTTLLALVQRLEMGAV